MADFVPVTPEFHQRTQRVRLKNLGTSNKKIFSQNQVQKDSESTFVFLIYHRFSNSGMKFVVGCRFSFFQIDAMNCFLKILQSDLKVFFFLWKIALHQNDIFYFGNQDTDS